jgi:hypothetical protein
MPVPEAYYQFVMDYAPHLYVIPDVGPDLTWGKAALAAGFAVDFLYEAYFDPQFDSRSSEIEAKIVDLADWLLTQQVTDAGKQAFGGTFRNRMINCPVKLIFGADKQKYTLTYDGGFRILTIPPHLTAQEKETIIRSTPSVLGMGVIRDFKMYLDKNKVELTI